MILRSAADYSLYLVTDTGLCRGRELIDVTLQAVQGGVTIVQLREKNISTRDFVDLARAMKSALNDFQVPLIINDRVDVMAATMADGIHVGQKDMHPYDVRQLLGNKCIVGLTVNNFSQLDESSDFDIDYIGLGPIFPTTTKENPAPVLGVGAIARARFSTTKSIVAIGGITENNAEEVYRAGVDGIAVVSAICSAENPQQAARKFRELQLKPLIENTSLFYKDNFETRNTETLVTSAQDNKIQ